MIPRLLLLLLVLAAAPAWADTSLATYDCGSTFNPITNDSTKWTAITGEDGSALDSNDTLAGQCNFTSGTGADKGVFYTGGVTWPNDQYVQMKVTVDSTSAGTGPCLVWRASAVAQTYYRACMSHASSDNITCTVVNAGSFSPCSGWPRTQSFSDADTFKARMVGTTIQIFLCNPTCAQIGADTTDGTIAAGNPGIGMSTNITSGSVDDWDAGSAAAGAASLPCALVGGCLIQKGLVGGGLVP